MEKSNHRPGTPAIYDRSNRAAGFTLIEISIVLVIIGLLVGAITVGHEMLNAAYVRAQIKQIEQYKTATYTFKQKYNYFPGDVPNAGNFGFFNTGMTGASAKGDGNGLVESLQQYVVLGDIYINGEVLVFWRHLSDANLIDGQFGANLAGGGYVPSNQIASQMPQWLPPAKLGRGSLMAYSLNGQNYFELMQPVDGGGLWSLQSNGGYQFGAVISPVNASTIDNKMDDGMPLSGKVQAVGSISGVTALGAAPIVSQHCINAANIYDTGSANGNGINCNLSFAF